MKKTLLLMAVLAMIAAPLAAQSITVTRPTGPFSMCQGFNYDITWTSSGVSGPVSVKLRPAGDPGAPPVLDIVASMDNTGLCYWVPPVSLAAGEYVIRVRTVSDSPLVYDDSDSFTIQPCPGEITVTSPAADAPWCSGSTYAITWTTTAGVFAPLSIKLRPASDPNAPPVLDIVPSMTNAGTYSWHIPASVPAGDYVVRVRTVADSPLVYDDSGVFTIKPCSTLVNRPPPDRLPPLAVKLPRLAVNDIDLTPNADGFGIIFSYKNVGAGALPKASEVPVKPNYRVLVDGRETASGSLFIPAFPAQPGWEQKGYFGGWITLLSGAQGVGDYQFHVGNMITVHINENKVMNMDSHSLTQNLKPIALKYGYDLILNSVHYDWDANAVTMSVRIDGKIPANKQLRFSCPGEFHDDVKLVPGQRLYSHRQKLVYKPSKKQRWIVLRLCANLVPFPVGNEKFLDIDMRNNFQERRFERPPRPAESSN